jgi:hypothetical protein
MNPRFVIYLDNVACCIILLQGEKAIKTTADMGEITVEEIYDDFAYELFLSFFLSSRFRRGGGPFEQDSNRFGWCDTNDLKSILDNFPPPWRYESRNAPQFVVDINTRVSPGDIQTFVSSLRTANREQ